MATTTASNWEKTTNATTGELVYTSQDIGYTTYRIVRGVGPQRRVFTLHNGGTVVTTGTLSQCQGAVVYVEPTVAETTTKPRGSGNHKFEVGGFSATSVLRWCGSQGWNWREAQEVFSAMHIEVKDTTVKLQVNSGRHGDDGWYGKVPTLPESLIARLNNLLALVRA